MGKIVKFCNACEEGFAEKFGFCPNCGAHLTAFEMSPIVEEKEPPKVEELAKTVSYFAPAPIKEFEPIPETVSTEAETVEIKASADSNEDAGIADTFEFDEEVFQETAELKNEVTEEAETVLPTVAFAANENKVNAADEIYNATYQTAPTNFQSQKNLDGNYRITIVEEKNVKQRNLLLLGCCLLFFGAFGVGLIYSMFNKLLDVGAIDTPTLLAFVGEVEPVPMEEVEIKKDKEKGGGGGGGGRDENTPASKGRSAAQVDDPLFSPSISYDKVSNPTIAIKAATKNKNERPEEDSDLRYGLRNGGDVLSDGSGTGGGQGNGRGRGQGNGDGNGLGNGRGDGRGDGNGDGEGNGKGGGGDFENVKVKKSEPVVPAGPTVALRIISKPRPNYTDTARTQNIQGTVLLKVTFLANGSIGGVSAVKGLGGGLTEQAIAAAKRISFEPAKRGGVPYTVTKTIEYSFNIY
jgi:TonB family protein